LSYVLGAKKRSCESWFPVNQALLSVSLTAFSGVRFEIIIAATMKILVVCNVKPCTLMDHYQHFGGSYCLYLQDRRLPTRLYGVKSKMAVIFRRGLVYNKYDKSKNKK
jgi:hypothetical protein